MNKDFWIIAATIGAILYAIHLNFPQVYPAIEKTIRPKPVVVEKIVERPVIVEKTVIVERRVRWEDNLIIDKIVEYPTRKKVYINGHYK